MMFTMLPLIVGIECVLGVTARGKNIASAVENVYVAVGKISWDGMHYRKDIARRALKTF